MSPRRQGGFTLIELVVALAILGTMLVLMYSGLSFALRSWDAGDANGRRTADRRIGENFLRREVTEIFPMRWKDPMQLRFAFEGKANSLRFVSTRPAGLALGGLALVGVDVEPDEAHHARNLVMRRVMADPDSEDFTPLDRSDRPSVLVEDVDSVTFSYFGAEGDFSEPKWYDEWTFPSRMPELVRLRIRTSDGGALPDMLVKLMLGEEAGCLENPLQRLCRPRRQ